MTPHNDPAASLRRALRALAEGRPLDSDAIDANLAHLLTSHRLQPLAERSLRTSPRVDPRSTDLLDAARRLRLRNALLRLELARLVIGLEEGDCRPIVLKGAALAHTAYADPGDRYFGDLDILVPRNRLDAATRILEASGYATSRHARAAVEKYDRHHFHRVLVSQAGVRVELHWDLTRPASPFRFDLEGFRGRCKTIDAEGVMLRVPSDGDQFLHAACQCAKDGFLELRRIIDATLLARCGAFDDPDLAGRARRQGLATPAWVLATLARELGDAAIPRAFFQAVRPGAIVVRCLDAARIADAAIDGQARRAGERQWIRWWCSPTAAAGLRAAARYVFPAEAELFDDEGAPSFGRGPGGLALATARRAGSAARATFVLGARAIGGPRRLGV